MRLYRPLFLLKLFFPQALFRVKTKKNVVFLTFDDGPDPVSTPGIIDILGKHGIRSTFFCTGSAAEKYPFLMEMIESGGHVKGNHGYNHSDGWFTRTDKYINNISMADEFTSDTLFRPPYGRIRCSQFKSLYNKYNIVFWDLMPYDFDRRLTPDAVLETLCSRIRPGAVVVLHDRPGSSALEVLDGFIKYAHKEGYSFLPLNESGQEEAGVSDHFLKTPVNKNTRDLT